MESRGVGIDSGQSMPSRVWSRRSVRLGVSGIALGAIGYWFLQAGINDPGSLPDALVLPVVICVVVSALVSLGGLGCVAVGLARGEGRGVLGGLLAGLVGLLPAVAAVLLIEAFASAIH